MNHSFKLNFQCFKLEQSLSKDFLMHFLESNSSIKALHLGEIPGRLDVDLSGILSLQQLQELHLIAIDESYVPPIISNLFQLKELRRLKLCFGGKRKMINAFLKSLKHFQHLEQLEMSMLLGDRKVVDIRDQDLMQIVHSPKLTWFTISSEYSHITLPGALEVIRNCPQLNAFCLDGFRQTFMPYGGKFVDQDIIDKFSAIYDKNLYTEYHRRDHCIWFHMDEYHNMIDVLKRCL